MYPVSWYYPPRERERTGEVRFPHSPLRVSLAGTGSKCYHRDVTQEAKDVLEYIRRHAPCTNKQITMHDMPHLRRVRREALKELLVSGAVVRDAALWYRLAPADEPAHSVENDHTSSDHT